ncbi:MAG: hypothetical protein HOV68_04375 [Streptomycetaceae bacterium]|nr:hypothetical protein [Streptomycetaceae bacterium]
MEAWPPRAPRRAQRRWRAGVVAVVAAVALLVTAPSSCDTKSVTAVEGILAGDAGAAPFAGNFGSDVLGLEAKVSAKNLKGDTPGLFGGTNKMSVCDKAKLVAFLAVNAIPAARWAKVLKLGSTERIAPYIARLTPVVLRTDTLVRNYTMDKDFNAILQAGTAVLLDEFGVPVVKCNCGNPLTQTKQDSGKVRLKTPDPTWKKKGSKPTKVDKPKTKIPRFYIADLKQPDQGIARPAATDGDQDEKAPPPAPLPDRDKPKTSKPGGSGSGTPSGSPSDSPSGTPTDTVSGTPTGPSGTGKRSPTTGKGTAGTGAAKTTHTSGPAADDTILIDQTTAAPDNS